MPFVSGAQERFFEAVRHGWRPDHVKAPPMKVVDEFHDASVGEDGHLKPSVKKDMANRKMLAAALRNSK